MLARRLLPSLAASTKSVLLLGPRQTGKSTLMAALEPDLTINLAHEPTYLEFARNPSELEQRLAALPVGRKRSRVLLDEVQRLPSLLNTVQVLLDRPDNRIRFLLTGSSARKLRRGQANLLPGRIHTYHLGPLTTAECGYALDTKQALATGTLPGVYTDPDASSRRKTLRSYAGTYLKEEVQAESLTRNLEGFARFLHATGEWSGHHFDISKLASAAQVARQSVARYMEVLEDTLIVRRVDPFTRSEVRRFVQHPKYYFFDGGVRNGLLGSFDAPADRIGMMFEHLVFSQLIAGAEAADEEIRVSSYRTSNGAEIDFLVERGRDLWALEVKASRNVGANDLRGLRAFADWYGKPHRAMVLCFGDVPRRIDGVDVLPWQEGFREMGL